jgi:hypothetical protein
MTDKDKNPMAATETPRKAKPMHRWQYAYTVQLTVPVWVDEAEFPASKWDLARGLATRLASMDDAEIAQQMSAWVRDPSGDTEERD